MIRRLHRWWRGLYALRIEEPERPFATDECSGGMSWIWRRLTGRALPWAAECIEHDRAYWQGGTAKDRREADAWLLAGVSASGHPYWGMVMFLAVRVGGCPWWPLPWRWNYGWKYLDSSKGVKP